METTEKRNCVLDRDAVRRKLRRMALQVAEQNSEEKDLLIAGIEGNGAVVAILLKEELEKAAGIRATLLTIRMNKKDPVSVSMDPQTDIRNKTVIVVDDVANTGRTIMYALKPFLDGYPKKVQTLVLVERSHKLFPVQTDYAGLSIATTLQEHITVETEGNSITGAWLY